MSEDVWTVSRSMLDPRVWLPYGHDGDQSCFLHAGALKAVKAWVEEHEDMTVYHWVKSGPDDWLLIDRDPRQPETTTAPHFGGSSTGVNGLT